MYNDLNDFISQTMVVENVDNEKIILIDFSDSVPVTLAGFKADGDLTDYRVHELGWEYYQDLQAEINKL
jgi:hypothetical protein